MTPTKPCKDCGNVYPLDHYRKHGLTEDGRVHLCWECINQDMDPEEAKVRAEAYAEHRGLTDRDWDIALEAVDAVKRYRRWFYKHSGRFRGDERNSEFEGQTAAEVVDSQISDRDKRVYVLELTAYLCKATDVDMTSRNRRTSTMGAA